MAGSVALAALQAATLQLLPDPASGARVPALVRHRSRGEPRLEAPPARARRPAHGRGGVQAQILPGAAHATLSPTRRYLVHPINAFGRLIDFPA